MTTGRALKSLVELRRIEERAKTPQLQVNREWVKKMGSRAPSYCRVIDRYETSPTTPTTADIDAIREHHALLLDEFRELRNVHAEAEEEAVNIVNEILQEQQPRPMMRSEDREDDVPVNVDREVEFAAGLADGRARAHRQRYESR